MYFFFSFFFWRRTQTTQTKPIPPFAQLQEPRFIMCLADLCTSNGTAMPRTQELICKAVFDDAQNADLLFETVLKNGLIAVRWLDEDGKRVTKLLLDLASPSKADDMSILEMYRSQLTLFSEMCLDRQYMAIKKLSPKLPIQLLHTCMSDVALPYDLRACYCRIMLHLHVDSEPQEAVTPVNYARLWGDIPEKISIDSYSHRSQTHAANSTAFAGVIEFVDQYLQIIEMVRWFFKKKRNTF